MRRGWGVGRTTQWWGSLLGCREKGLSPIISPRHEGGVVVGRAVTITADISYHLLRRRAKKSKKNNPNCINWWYCRITPVRTLLIWQKSLSRDWVGKSFHTHVIYLITPQIFTFSVHYLTILPFLPFLSEWKCALLDDFTKPPYFVELKNYFKINKLL